jgi:hypothetical protein
MTLDPIKLPSYEILDTSQEKMEISPCPTLRTLPTYNNKSHLKSCPSCCSKLYIKEKLMVILAYIYIYMLVFSAIITILATQK